MKILKLSLFFIFVVGTQILYAQNNRSGRNDRRRDRENKLEVREEVTEQPCQRFDDDEYFAASGFRRVKMGGVGERDYTLEINALLNNLKEQVKLKIGGRYQAVVRDYMNQMDFDDKSSAASHIESAGEQVVDRVLGDLEEDCRNFGEMDESGFQNIYIGILVAKSSLIDALVDGVENSDAVPQNVQQQIRKNESAFRESFDKHFNTGKNNE